MSRVGTLHSPNPRIPTDVKWRTDLTSMKIPAAGARRTGLDLRSPERFGHDIDDARLGLELSGHAEERRGPRKHRVFVEHPLPDHDVHEPGLVLKRHEGHGG